MASLKDSLPLHEQLLFQWQTCLAVPEYLRFNEMISRGGALAKSVYERMKGASGVGILTVVRQLSTRRGVKAHRFGQLEMPAAFARVLGCGVCLPMTQDGGSLAGNDSREASSTGSNSASFSWFSCEMAARTCFLLSQK